MKKLCNRLVILFAVLLALPVCAENKFCEVGFKAISSSEGHEGAGIIDVIRDGYIPKADRIREQYRAYLENGEAYIGYLFGGEYSVNTLLFYPGLIGEDGGEFTDVRCEVLTGGVWTEIDAYFTPEYPSDTLENGCYSVNFEPVSAEGIRLIGSADYVSCSELKVLCDVEEVPVMEIDDSLWIESSATPIATVTVPDISGGSRDITDINDGYIPKEGDPYPMQYDTVTAVGKNEPHEEYIGLMFGSDYEVELIEFTEGGNFWDGGWFADGSMRVEVNIDYNWIVTDFTVTPDYPNSNDREDFLPDYETYTIRLDNPVKCRGIRLAGKAGGEANFISCGEFRVKRVEEKQEIVETAPEPEIDTENGEIAENVNKYSYIYIIFAVIILAVAVGVVILVKMIKTKRTKTK